MADIPIKFYKSVVRSQKFNPSNPPDLEDPAPVVNPPGSVPTTLYKLLGDVTDSDFIGKNGFVPVVVGENVLTLQSLTTNVLSTPLTGYVVGANTALAATDTILGAFQQVQGQINARVGGTGSNNYIPRYTPNGTTLGNSYFYQIGVRTFHGGDTILRVASIEGKSFINDDIGDLFLNFGSSGNSYIQSGLGNVGIGVSSGTTAKLDVNGTARIRTISNGVGDFLTKDATGVITSRKASEVRTDIGAFPSASLSIASGQVAFGTGVNTVGGDSGLVWDNTNKYLSSLKGFRLARISDNAFSGLIRPINTLDFELRNNGGVQSFLQILAGGSIVFGGGASTEFGRINSVGLSILTGTSPTNTLDVNGTARIRTISNGVGDFLTKSATGVITSRTAAEVASDIGAIVNTNQTVTTVGTINDLTRTGSNIIFTGISAVTLTGLNAGNDGEEIRIVNYSSALLTIAHENVGSVASNRIRGNCVLARFGMAAILKYRATLARWVVISGWWGSDTVNGFYTSNSVGVNVLPTSTISLNIASTGNTSATTALFVTDLAGNQSLNVAGSRNVYIPFQLSVGTTSSPLANVKLTVRGSGTGTNTNLRLEDSAGTLKMLFLDNGNVQLDTTTGSIIATSNLQKLGFWNATPIVQPTTAVTAGTLVSNAGTTLTSTDTIDGYTLLQIVKALRNTGLLA